VLRCLLVQPVDDLRRSVLWRTKAKPPARLVAWHEFGNGRDVRQRGRARRCGDRQCAQLAGSDVPYGELFKMMAGVDLASVAYRGGGPALVDLLGGQVQVMFEGIASSIAACGGFPLPAVAILIFPGLALA
jgi:hypothetical protein